MSGILIHLAWNALEASLLAALILLVSWLRTPSAPLRHALWLLVALKLLLPPIDMPGAGIRDGLRSAVTAIAGRGAARTIPETPPGAPGRQEPPLTAAGEGDDNRVCLESKEVIEDGAGAVEIADEVDPSLAPPAIARTRWTPPIDIETAAAVLWLAGVTVLLLRRARRVIALRALFRKSEEAPAAVRIECAALAARLRIRNPPRVLVATWAPSPFLSAAGAPVIVLPSCLVEPGHGALEAVLAHELAHLKRRDHWASWVDLLATTVFWWLPTAWIASSAMERASDEAADACAATALGSRRTYAASLVETLEVLSWNQTPFAIPGRGLGEKEAVERRLVMVLRHPLFTGLSVRSRIALVTLGLFVLPAAPGPAPSQTAATAEPVLAPDAPTALEPPSADAAPVALPAPAATPVPAKAHGAASSGTAPVALPRGAGATIYGTAGGNSVALAAPEDAPRGFEERLGDVEKKVDRLLQQMERLTRSMAPYPPATSAAPRDDYGDLRPPGNVPRARTPRAAVGMSPGKAPSTVQPGQQAIPATRGQARRLKAIERQFEERASALRKELAELEAALEEEMRAAIEDDPDAPGGSGAGSPGRGTPAPSPAPRVPGDVSTPNGAGATAPGPAKAVQPVLPAQPTQPAQPAAVPPPRAVKP